MIIGIMTASLSAGLPLRDYSAPSIGAFTGNWEQRTQLPLEPRKKYGGVRQEALDGPGRRTPGMTEPFYVASGGSGVFGSSNPYVSGQRSRPVRQPRGRAKDCGSRKGRL